MPSVADTVQRLFQDSNRLRAEGQPEAAEDALRQALALAPDQAEVHANLALLLEDRGALAEAESHYRRALALKPEQSQILLNFGAMLAGQKRFAEAEDGYRRALAITPDSPAVLSNLGVLLASLKREAEAEQCYRRALALAPDHRKSAFNLAYLLLRQGRYEEGWQRLESRDWYAPLEDYLTCPRWRGEALAGKSLLIGFEAGHGDMIQLCRYAALVKARGARQVSVLCHPGLVSLFARMPAVDEALAVDAPFPASGWDFWAPPLSLPGLFQTRLDTIPAALPYLNADPARIGHWAEVLGPRREALRVGLVWQGNPRFENDAERSLASLALLAPLADVAGIRWISLQKGRGEAEAAQPPAGWAIDEWGSRCVDFADTAALVMNLDLVIAVDTAVAHLSGALGKSCWLLLPDYQTDWRWLKEREDTPWYPGVMRLFRQPAGGGWGPVIERVKNALQALVRSTQP
ncbi:tetratricopeptide repeat protein [Denitratisoma sp. agr-D3]